MSWLIFVLLSIITLTAIALLEKYLIAHKIKDPFFLVSLVGVGFFIFATTLALIFNAIELSLAIIPAILAGMAHIGALFFYYQALKSEEVSRLMPLLSFIGVFVLIFAYLFLGETFTYLQYTGVFAIIIGSFILSLRSFKDIKISYTFFLIFFASFLFALRIIFIEYSLQTFSVLGFIFWMGIGSLILTIPILLVSTHKIIKREVEGIRISLFTSVLFIILIFSISSALLFGPATLTSALLQTSSFFIFLIATLITYFSPEIMKEKISKRIIIQKIFAITLIFIGTLLII
tara:strand:- start:200 stop:1069 length:870 start_codon:yes stop_codon:yes gene_type:complete